MCLSCRGFSPVSGACEATATETRVFKSTPAVFVSSGSTGLTTFTSATFTPTKLASTAVNKVIAPAFVVQWGAKNAVITSLLASQSDDGADNGGGGGGSGSTSPPSGGSSSLSGGAIAGIVIGAIAGVALVIAVIFFFLRRRRSKNSKVATVEETAPPPHHWDKAELAGRPVTPTLPPQELAGDNIAAKYHQQEADPVELEGDVPRPTGPAEMAAVGTPVTGHSPFQHGTAEMAAVGTPVAGHSPLNSRTALNQIPQSVSALHSGGWRDSTILMFQ
jgi:hypothetical protein